MLEPSSVPNDSGGQTQHVWAVPALLCAMQYINHPRDLPGKKNSMKIRTLRQRKANVESRAAAVRSKENYRKQQVEQIVPLKNTRAGEELFLDCALS